MKKIVLLLLIAFSTSFYAQENIRVEFNKNSDLYLNSNVINNQTSYSKIVEILGEPELIKESKSGVKNYAYANYGIAFKVYKDKLTMIGFNYNWDGDNNFPNKSFTGVLIIGTIQLDTNTNKDFLKKNAFLTFENLFSELFAAKTNKNVAVMAGFKNEKITQIGFEFKQ